jgi:hypothetical protein
MTSKTSIVQKLLALAASAALIGSPCEAEAALSRAMTIAAAHNIEIAPLAAAAGVTLPPLPALLSSSVVATLRGGTLTRTIDRAGKIEICTLDEDGRTEVYMDIEGDGIRTFLGYHHDLDEDVYAQVESVCAVHWRTHFAYHNAR